MKKIVLFVLALITAGHLKSQVLDVTEIFQEQTKWCWAAVSACVLDYYCMPKQQCEIADYTRRVATWHDFGNTNCCTDPSLGCNHTNMLWNYDGSTVDILKHFGNISTDVVNAHLTKSEITSEINANKLFIISWKWPGQNGNHFIIGHGLVDNKMYYMDPWYGQGLKVADYDWVVSGNYHIWNYTVRMSDIPETYTVPEDAGAISGIDTLCQGQTSVNYTVPPIKNASSYIWTLPTGATGTSTTNSIDVDFETPFISGEIEVRGVNRCGEGKTSSLPITVKPKPDTPIITSEGLTLYSNAPTGNQWYDDYGKIKGATEQTYTAPFNGTYYVIVTLSDCSSERSNNIVVTKAKKKVEKVFHAYPNPVKNELIIEVERNKNKINYEILNGFGQIVHKGNLVRQTTINISHFAPGLYIIKFENNDTFAFKKIIKQ